MDDVIVLLILYPLPKFRLIVVLLCGYPGWFCNRSIMQNMICVGLLGTLLRRVQGRGHGYPLITVRMHCKCCAAVTTKK